MKGGSFRRIGSYRHIDDALIAAFGEYIKLRERGFFEDEVQLEASGPVGYIDEDGKKEQYKAIIAIGPRQVELNLKTMVGRTYIDGYYLENKIFYSGNLYITGQNSPLKTEDSEIRHPLIDSTIRIERSEPRIVARLLNHGRMIRVGLEQTIIDEIQDEEGEHEGRKLLGNVYLFPSKKR